MAHQFVEWDGWEEGMAESMLGLEEFEEDWFKGVEYNADSTLSSPVPEPVHVDEGGELLARVSNNGTVPLNAITNGGDVEDSGLGVGRPLAVKALNALAARRKASSNIPNITQETEKEEIFAVGAVANRGEG
ncbi:hypothetical protein PQX77_017286 [Marasmius sp. AFHP31]|nr:hypothetical protein PQX77_017286 [Marasmius sp. AFHP31]